jgi:hypothetical protein
MVSAATHLASAVKSGDNGNSVALDVLVAFADVRMSYDLRTNDSALNKGLLNPTE